MKFDLLSTPLPVCRLRIVLVCACFIAPFTSGAAQDVGRLEQIEANTSPFYYFARPGEVTTQVSLWGGIARPGYYEVGSEVGLEKLLALAGGPITISRDVGIRTNVTLQLFREQASVRSQIYEIDLESFLRNQEAVPTLQDGDIVVVEVVRRRLFDWRDALSVATAAAALILAIDRITSN